MNKPDRLYKLMEQYEITDNNIISDLDMEILKELRVYKLFNREGIRSLLNDFKRLLERKGA